MIFAEPISSSSRWNQGTLNAAAYAAQEATNLANETAELATEAANKAAQCESFTMFTAHSVLYDPYSILVSPWQLLLTLGKSWSKLEKMLWPLLRCAHHFFPSASLRMTDERLHRVSSEDSMGWLSSPTLHRSSASELRVLVSDSNSSLSPSCFAD